MFLCDENEWLECGAFCVKFYDGGKEDIVIIDDAFPFLGEELAFVSSQTPEELWPCILEKAYAKKYQTYSGIVGGLVDIALAELTNGVPEDIEINENSNLKKIWDNMIERQKEGSMLGAGSPSHPDGDRAKSGTGIVQGHAYSILKLVQVDKHMLI